MSAGGKASVLRAVIGGLVSALVLLVAPVHAPCAERSLNGSRSGAMASALQVLERNMRNGSPQLREASFAALSRYYCEGDHAKPKCIWLATQGTESFDWKVRLLNLPNAFLQGIPQPLARKVATGALRDSDPSLRRAAAKLLAQHPEPWAREMTEKLAHSPDPIVRVHAAASLVRLGEKAYERVLSKAMDGKDPEVAAEAATHLIALRTKTATRARSKMAELLKDRDEVVRANAVYCLSELKQDRWSLGLIEQSLSDDSPLVRIAGISSVPRLDLSQSEAVSFLGLMARRWPREHVLAVRVDILDAVERLERRGMLPREAAVRFLSIAVNGQSGSVIGCLAMGIRSFPNRRHYLKRLLTLAETPNIDLNLRLIALAELGRSHDPDLTEPLFKLMKRHRSDNSEHALRVACAAAIVRLHNATQAGPAIEDTAVGEESIASGPGK